MALSDFLEAYYKCDGSSGASVVDIHNGHNLADGGTVGAGTGLLNGSRVYSTSKYSEVATHADLEFDGSDALCVSFWVKLSSTTGQLLVSKSDFSNSRDWEVYHDGTNFKFLTPGPAIATATNFGAIGTGTWHHVLCWYSPTDSKNYIRIDNGTANEAASTGPSIGGAPFGFGNTWHGLGNFGAEFDIDEVAILRLDPDSGQQDDLYNGGSPLAYEDFFEALQPGRPSLVSATDTTINLISVAASGGVTPYTYQWQRATAANGTFNDLSGETSLTLADNDSLVDGTVYWYRLEITDDDATVEYSRPIPAKLWPAPMAVWAIGDSQLAHPSVAAQAFVDELKVSVKARIVTLEGNDAAGGTKSGDWIPGASGTPLENAIADAITAGATHVLCVLGSNDSTNSGVGAISAATYGANMSDIVDYIVGEGLKVILGYPTFYDHTTLGAEYGNSAQALLDYQAQLDALDDGDNVIVADKKTYYDIPLDILDLTTDLLHLSAEGQALWGANLARGYAMRAYSPTPAEIAAAVWAYGDRTLTA
jgi:lysophospholipase L1-like esterase